jgi:large subunit ribosomal protein L31
MKKGIHPEYREVLFKDVSCGFELITRSTVKAEETVVWKDGKTYPIVKLQVSSGSHPFFTGQQKVMDTAGRIDRLKKKFGTKVALGSQKGMKPPPPPPPAPKKKPDEDKPAAGKAAK